MCMTRSPVVLLAHFSSPVPLLSSSVTILVSFLKFTVTPLCCPSRSSILTGQYPHNHEVRNNSLLGNCSSPQWQKGPESQAFPVFLSKLKYETFFAGKYLNQVWAIQKPSWLIGFIIAIRQLFVLNLCVKNKDIFKKLGRKVIHLYVQSEWISPSISTGRRKQEMSATFLQAGTSGMHWWGLKHPKAAFAWHSEVMVFALRSQVGNSQYYNYSLSVNGKEEKHGDSYEADYLTDLIVSMLTMRNTHFTGNLLLLGPQPTRHFKLKGYLCGEIRSFTLLESAVHTETDVLSQFGDQMLIINI